LPLSLLQPRYLRPRFSPQPSSLWHSNGRSTKASWVLP